MTDTRACFDALGDVFRADLADGLTIRDGRVELTRGELPDDALLTVWMPAGLWASILLKKTRIETALFKGKIKFEGKAEEALKLREVFRL